jgi:hypothetical protein
MASFEAFDAVLATPMPADHWNDVEVVRASELVEGFDAADWELVRKSWPLRPSAWQIRLADAIFGTAATEATRSRARRPTASSRATAGPQVPTIAARSSVSARGSARREAASSIGCSFASGPPLDHSAVSAAAEGRARGLT